MDNRPEIVFTLPACMGGVASFNYNIINYSAEIKKYRSKVILLKAESDNRPLFTDQFSVDETIVFHYSYEENQYRVQERLNKLIGDDDGLIVTDNALTIVSARRFNNPKTVFHLLHDFFYVEQNIKMGSMVDACIAHSSFFSDAVFSADPNGFAGRSFYIPYGVVQLDTMPAKIDGNLNLVFLGRLAESKGVKLLHEIEKVLQSQNVTVNWNIIGKGQLKDVVRQQWEGKHNVKFYEPDSVDEVYNILQSQDIFVFPTSYEGTPVSILESLSNGVITVVNDLPGGIRDIVTEGIGHRCPLNNVQAFADRIAFLSQNKDTLRQMQRNCVELAHKSYDIKHNADNYFRCFEKYKELKRATKKSAPLLSRWDKPYIPDALTKMIRSLRN